MLSAGRNADHPTLWVSPKSSSLSVVSGLKAGRNTYLATDADAQTKAFYDPPRVMLKYPTVRNQIRFATAAKSLLSIARSEILPVLTQWRWLPHRSNVICR